MPEPITRADLTAALNEQTEAIGEKIENLADLLTAVHKDIKRALDIMDYGGRLDTHEAVMRDLAAEVGKPELAKRLHVYERPNV